jgi:transcriptional regulator with XRE-family HTH domain
MKKLKWRIYSDRLKSSGLSKAEIARQTGIHYSRLSGFFNGYWNLQKHELAEVDKLLEVPVEVAAE